MASWGDVALARTWSGPSKRRVFQATEHAQPGHAARPGSLGLWNRPGDAGLTAKPSRAERLVESADGGPAAVPRPPAVAQASERPLRVLIADDHPMYTELLLRQLAGREWIEVVGCAANGRDAVVLATAAAPDVILMDLEMPLMDGIEAMRRIRQQRPLVAILVLTASAPQVDRDRALAAGALAILPKTIDAAELIGHLENALLARDGQPSALPRGA
jgi:CheY-like chemotaxis protein